MLFPFVVAVALLGQNQPQPPAQAAQIQAIDAKIAALEAVLADLRAQRAALTGEATPTPPPPGGAETRPPGDGTPATGVPPLLSGAWDRVVTWNPGTQQWGTRVPKIAGGKIPPPEKPVKGINELAGVTFVVRYLPNGIADRAGNMAHGPGYFVFAQGPAGEQPVMRLAPSGAKNGNANSPPGWIAFTEPGFYADTGYAADGTQKAPAQAAPPANPEPTPSQSPPQGPSTAPPANPSYPLDR